MYRIPRDNTICPFHFRFTGARGAGGAPGVLSNNKLSQAHAVPVSVGLPVLFAATSEADPAGSQALFYRLRPKPAKLSKSAPTLLPSQPTTAANGL